MNKNILFLFFILISSTLIAQQEDTTDVVFPIKGKPIKNCTVIDIGPGNLISYQLESDTLRVLSRAYIKDGVLINVFYNEGSIHEETVKESDIRNNPKLNFEENRDYYYHQTLYKKYRRRSMGSIPFLAAGFGVFAGGAALHFHEKESSNYEDIPIEDRPAFILMALGGVSLITGTIIFSINSTNAMQHKREMKKKESNTITISLGIQQNGLGVNIKF